MGQIILGKPGDVLESVYNLQLEEPDWISEVTRGIGQFIGGGNGTLGALFRMGGQVQMPVLRPVEADDEVPAFIQYLRATDQARAEARTVQRFGQRPNSAPQGDMDRFGKLFAESGMGTLSVNRSDAPAYQIFKREFEHHGVIDAAGLIVPHPASRSYIFFTARHREFSGVPERARGRWISLQKHIAAVYDLRFRLQNGHFDERDAVWFDTASKCVEAGPAQNPMLRERLRQLVNDREAALSRKTSSQRGDLNRYWSNVLSGKWAILDRFDSDGRRFVVAVPISKYGDKLRGLSTRERKVFALLGSGLPNKLIGFELEISETAVSTHVHRIFSKLGIADRSALVQLSQVFRKRGAV